MKASLQDFITKIFTQIKNNYGNVDNTSDEDKPISIAQRSEFDKLNSNLDTLEFGEVAGGKNILDIQNKVLATSGDVMSSRVVFPNGTYSFSFDIDSIAGAFEMCIDNASGTRKSVVSGSSTGHYTGTYIGDIAYMFVYSNNAISLKNFMMNKGSVSLPYEPYIMSNLQLTQQNESLNDEEFLGWSVPEDCTTKNYVDEYGNFHQIVDRVFLDGDETYASYNVTANGAIAINYTQLGISANEKNHILFINNLNKMSTVSELTNGKVGWFTTTRDNYLYINRKGSASSVDEFKNSLKTNPLEIIYALDTGIVHKVGNEAVTQIKNDLAKLFSSNITGIKLNGSTLEVSFNNGTSVGKVSFEGIVEEETILS